MWSPIRGVIRHALRSPITQFSRSEPPTLFTLECSSSLNPFPPPPPPRTHTHTQIPTWTVRTRSYTSAREAINITGPAGQQAQPCCSLAKSRVTSYMYTVKRQPTCVWICHLCTPGRTSGGFGGFSMATG